MMRKTMEIKSQFDKRNESSALKKQLNDALRYNATLFELINPQLHSHAILFVTAKSQLYCIGSLLQIFVDQ